MKKTLTVLAVLAFSAPILVQTADARNKRSIIQNKKGKATASWAKAGVRKFIRAYTGRWKYKILSGGETSWRKYPGKKDVRISQVTYLINGNKRNVAYVWGYTKGNSILAVVANASPRQQSLKSDIRALLKNVE